MRALLFEYPQQTFVSVFYLFGQLVPVQRVVAVETVNEPHFIVGVFNFADGTRKMRSRGTCLRCGTCEITITIVL